MKPGHGALRAGTRLAHERLDALFGDFDLTRRESYAAFLTAHAAALFPIEAWLDKHAPLVIEDWPARRRSHLLHADLTALGVEPPSAVTPIPDLNDEAGVAGVGGVLYVVEGSRLGGKVLARRVPPSLPRAYLDADQRAGAWPTLLASIDAALRDEQERARGIEAAIAIFALFEGAGHIALEAAPEWARISTST